MTTAQQRIVEFVRQNGRANLAEMEPVFGVHYYANGRAHLSRRLARLVATGALQRTRRGEFQIRPLPFLRRTVVRDDGTQHLLEL